MSTKYAYEPVDKTGCDLVTLRKAAKALHMAPNTFNEKALKREVPPPIHDSSIRYWSLNQLDAFSRGEIKASNHGIWYRWDAENECWRKLPNQYRNTLPSDTA